MSAPALDPETRVGEARRRLAAAFAACSGEEAGLDARLLIEAATGLRHAALIAAPERGLGAAAEVLRAMAARRIAGEPVSRIVGAREFWSMRFRVTPDTLDPRPDTETLIEAAVEAMAGRRCEALRIVDFGTGTGAILAALLSEFPNARGVGVDLSPAAAAVARDNLEALGLGGRAEIVVADWDAGLRGGRDGVGVFDIVASNPPYIESAAIATLAPEVRGHDPRLALDGGADGLDAYRALASVAARRLAAGGLAAFEVGVGQAGAVSALLAAQGLKSVAPRRDLGGIERVAMAWKAR